MRLLESYIKSVLSERNFKKNFKRPFDYDLVIFDHIRDGKRARPSNIFSFFKKSESLRENILDVKVNVSKKEDGSQINRDNEEDVIVKSLENSSLSIIEFKQNKAVFEVLEKEFKFDFSNCNLKDNNPILCVPAMIGDDVNRAKGYDEQSKQVKDQKLEDEDMNWMLHDMQHHDSQIESLNKDLFGFVKVFPKSMLNLEEKGKSGELKDEAHDFLSVMLEYFINIGYTKGLKSSNLVDVSNSVYAYCLNQMKSNSDAFKIDFTNLDSPFSPDKISNKDSKEMQEILSKCYDVVNKNSKLSRYKESKMSKLKNMILKKKINKNKSFISKLKNGSIYIYYLTS